MLELEDKEILTVEEQNHFEVLIVDDEQNNILVLDEILSSEGYRTRAALNGKIALKTIKRKQPDIILLDVNMPEMDGYELASILKNEEGFMDIPIIFLSALSSTENKVKGLELHGVDYIVKPYNVDELLARVRTQLELGRIRKLLKIKNSELNEIVYLQATELTKVHLAIVYTMVELAESRDDDTGKHIKRISVYSKKMAELAMAEGYEKASEPFYIPNIEMASPLHDIGKIAIRDEVLLKPGKLTEEEFEYMKTHVSIGADKLEKIGQSIPDNQYVKMGEEIARYHHEKWDGSGYLAGLAGKDIPLSARIMAICDVYDALRSKRVYKLAYSHEKAISILKESSGTHFDPELLKLFMKEHLWFDKTFNELSG